MDHINEPERVVERLLSTFSTHRLDELERLHSVTVCTPRLGWPAEAGVKDS